MPNRRHLIKTLATTSFGAGLLLHSEAKAGQESEPSQKQLSMLIDLDKCIGCRACTVACKSENGVKLGSFRTWVEEKEMGEYPQVKRHFLPRFCNHCDNAPCLLTCPTTAIEKNKNGVVVINKDKCEGNKACVVACPYEAVYFNDDTENPAPEYMARQPEKADKCDFCQHRTDKGLEPSCVNTCPSGALVFGDLNDSHAAISQKIKEEDVRVLMEEKGTKPRVYYKGGNISVFERG